MRATKDGGEQELGMAEHLTDPIGSEPIRSAKFERPPKSGMTDEWTATDAPGRRATFRPAETVAIRRDVVEAYRASRLQDADVADTEGGQLAAWFDVALSDEALHQYDRAAVVFEKMRAREFEFEVDHLFAMRRVARSLGWIEDESVAIEALQESEFGRLASIDRALCAWRSGDDRNRVLERVVEATSGVDSVKTMGVLAAWGSIQLTVDCLIEASKVDDALDALSKLAHHPGLESRERDALLEQKAYWELAFGKIQEARDSLLTVGPSLSSGGRDLLVFLALVNDARDLAEEVLAEAKVGESDDPAMLMAIGDARQKAGVDPLDAYRAAEESSPEDPFVLRRLAAELEFLRGPQDELINILNRRLEVEDMTPAGRVAVLGRLGRLYESQPDFEDAAAEVYREALELKPDDAPTLRALGRLYARKGHWEGLVELFEREIEVMGDAPSVWRRHFQAAELLDERLRKHARALEHYRRVLASKPVYLPALKGAARILETSHRWTELADLFLESVPLATTARQKLYLLTKVAEVAESHLDNIEIAVGAWEEILHISPDHPIAYSALGRLYARTERWNQLIELNLRELDLIQDPEEASALLVRTAEIAIGYLGDDARGEALLRDALERVPDYLPGLEALGRLYLRGGRWDDLIDMTDHQLMATHDEREILRQLGSLAEILETRLGCEADATRIYEEIAKMRPSDAHATDALDRLYRKQGRWGEVVDQMESSLSEPLDVETRVRLHCEAAQIHEWRFEDQQAAFAHWMGALNHVASNPHALEGVMRTFPGAQMSREHLITRLEDLAARPMSAEMRDRYFLHLSRLQEVGGSGPEASRAWRQFGDRDAAENQSILELNHLHDAERSAVVDHRIAHPSVFLDGLMYSLDNLKEEVRESFETVVTGRLSADEVRYVAGMCRLEHAAPIHARGNEDQKVGADLVRTLQGRLHDQEPSTARQTRLRAIASRGDLDEFVETTRRELEVLESPTLRAARMLDVAATYGIDRREVALEWLERAVAEVIDAGGANAVLRNRLYSEMETIEAWEIMRDALQAVLSVGDLDQTARVHACEKLGWVCEEYLSDAIAARDAYLECWDIAKSRTHIEHVVSLSVELGEDDVARTWQASHYQSTIADEDATLDERTASALKLADLEVSCGSEADAIHLLESCLQASPESDQQILVLRQLARLHARFGDARRAVGIFQKVLPIHPTEDFAADWRTLIEVHRRQLDDRITAYSLQWKLVRSLPTSEIDIEELLEFAFELDEMADCCERLVEFAEEASTEAARVLLGRAGEAYDEDLNLAADAARVYQKLVEITEGSERRHWVRRLAFVLGRVAGKEREALSNFKRLVAEEPFELTTYRGMADLLERVQAHDRARIVREVLATVDETTTVDEIRVKTSPSRALPESQVAELLAPRELGQGVFDMLRAASPLIEKIWSDDLPQRKALNGSRLKDGALYESVESAMSLFGMRRPRVVVGDAGPMSPQAFADGTVWFNLDLVHGANEAELRFFAGYAASLAWANLAPVAASDGRQVWHLLEATSLRQNGVGFSDRVDRVSQEIAELVGSPLMAVSRRKLAAAIESVELELDRVHCEAWPRDIERYACRTGLVLAGHVPDAVRAVLRFDGWEHPLDDPASQKRVRNSPLICDLIEFALSDGYLEARYAAGLSGRPSTLSI